MFVVRSMLFWSAMLKLLKEKVSKGNGGGKAIQSRAVRKVRGMLEFYLHGCQAAYIILRHRVSVQVRIGRSSNVVVRSANSRLDRGAINDYPTVIFWPILT